MGSPPGRQEIPAGINNDMREVRFTSAEGERSIRSKLAKGGPIAVRLRVPRDQDVEGHSLGDTAVLVRASIDDDDVEGHAISIHFPNAGQARDFRNGLIAAGALTATLALGVGLSELAPQANLGQAQVGSGTQSNAVWIDTSAGMREGTLSSVSIGAQAPAFSGVPHQVAPEEGGGAAAPEGGATAPATQIPHQVPPDNL
jgi:hypothetical protein